MALSLIALIACGGIAFDYARLATMDTELQNAADQAALAAASQLDGKTRTCARASAAAVNLLNNSTLLANEISSRAITVTDEATCDATGLIRFYQSYDQATDTPGLAANSDENAKVVLVTVNSREAVYALTPIVSAFRSGNVSAEAVATVNSSICKVPPLLMCNPDETSTVLTFNAANYRGKGIKLVQGGNSGGYWTPGNFGYLNPPSGSVEYNLGANNPPGDCYSGSGVQVKPGAQTSVTDALNTRFDIFQNGLTNSCNGTACSPALNTRKDVVHPEISGPPPSNCGLANGTDPWDLPASPGVQYIPNASTGVQASPYPTTMGLPRDTCHAKTMDGVCANGRIGDGSWDRNVYFYANHRSLYTPTNPSVPDSNWNSIPSLIAFATANSITLSNITRYDTYRWEIASGNLARKFDHSETKGKKTVDYYSYSSPQCKVGITPTASQPDRRLVDVAVANCTQQGINGNSNKDIVIIAWTEMFLTEPSIDRARTSKTDIYGEVVRETNIGSNTITAQAVRRDVPYLLK